MIEKTTVYSNAKSNSSELDVDKRIRDRQIKSPDELSANDWVRFSLAKWILAVSGILMLVAWGIHIAVELWGMPDIEAYCALANDTLSADGQESNACSYANALATSRADAAQGIFEFAKTWIPPIVTLVLGYYFARENDQTRST